MQVESVWRKPFPHESWRRMSRTSTERSYVPGRVPEELDRRLWRYCAEGIPPLKDSCHSIMVGLSGYLFTIHEEAEHLRYRRATSKLGSRDASQPAGDDYVM